MTQRSPQRKTNPEPAFEPAAAAFADGTVSLGRLETYLGFRMRRVHSILSRDFFAATRQWNLREGMFSALELIAANPGISQAQVSQAIGLDRSAMVMVMDELEKRFWAKRQRCAQDRRRHRLSITPAGAKVLDSLFRCMEEAEARALAALDDRDLATVCRALDRIYEAYAAPGAEASREAGTARSPRAGTRSVR